MIYTKDVQRITGKSDRYARRLMARMKLKYQKEKGQPVSLNEFCEYMGLTKEEVSNFLDG